MAQFIWGDTPDPLPELDFVALDKSWTKYLPENSTIIENRGHGSSLWSQAAKITVRLQDGTTQAFFIKLTETPTRRQMAEGEYLSSVQLYKYGPDIFPRPLGWGNFEYEPGLYFFMCGFVELMDEVFPKPNQICPQLAAMHLASASSPDNPQSFGFQVNTCTGTTEQDNTWSVSWEAFFTTKIANLFRQDETVHGPCAEYDTLKPLLYEKVIPRLLRPLETGGNTITPVLVHGDLWHCNSATQARSGRVLLFDPASFWAHHEFEMYEWCAERYVFDKKYVEEYRRYFPPSEPKKEADDRLALYTLVVDLVDSILYPASTQYRASAISTSRRLSRKFGEGYTGRCERKDRQEGSVDGNTKQQDVTSGSGKVDGGLEHSADSGLAADDSTAVKGLGSAGPQKWAIGT